MVDVFGFEIKRKDKDNISTISVFKGCIKYSNPLRKYICYKINNQCVFSENENLTYTPCFTFYTTNHICCFKTCHIQENTCFLGPVHRIGGPVARAIT